MLLNQEALASLFLFSEHSGSDGASLMLEVILRSCFELCLFIAFQALKRSFEGNPTMTVRGLANAAPTASQTIDFGSLNEDAVAVAVKSTDVRIVSSPGDHVTGSSKVRINNVVDYTWEEKFYSGQLLAVHMSGKYIAYGIKAGGKSQSVIRVVNRQTSARTLIKGIGGTVEDLAFAYMNDRYVLASLDSEGTLLVHVVIENEKDIACQLLLTTVPGEPLDPTNPKRVFWCPYIPDEVEDTEDGYLLALTRGNKIELWSVSIVTRAYGPGPFSSKNITNGYIEIEASSTIISDAAFSPDGTAIATASHDGRCKFYQVYMHSDGEPRLLHEWEPHDGEPVNTLFFLDDHVNPQNDIQFWKYAVTGAKDNCEIKVWSCETWECLQKISVTTRSSRHSRGWGKLKATIDLSAGYILLSDMYLRLFYVLELRKDAGNIIQPFVQTITEFKLPCPILSFGIVDASVKTLEKNTEFDSEELCNGDSDDEPQSAVVVRMYFVQPKSLQECQIVFQTSNAIEVHHNMLHNVSAPVTDNIVKKDVDEESNQPAPILMTPDAFHSPHQGSSRTSPPAAPVVVSLTPPPSVIPLIPAPDAQELPPPSVAIVSQSETSFDITGPFASCGSSPSREVEEILSTTKTKITAKMLEEFVHKESSTEKVKALEANVCSLRDEVDVLKADNSALTQSLIALATQQALDLKSLRDEIRRSNAETVTAASMEAVVMRAVASQPQPAVDSELIVKQLCSALNKDVARTLSLSVANSFKEDIKPVHTQAIDQMKNMIHNELSHKLNLTDQALKDNLAKVLRSKNMVETLSHSFNATASDALEGVFKDSITKFAIPIFEKASLSMFQQVNRAVTEGLKEYKKELELYASKANERTNMEVNALQTAVDDIRLASKTFSTTVDKDVKRLDESMADLARKLNNMSLNNGIVRSGSVTPAPHMVDSQVLQAQISQLINQGHINTAFQEALSASDLNLVLYCCEKVGLNQVFNGPGGCLLQQHVLLSLIQQLSADMSRHTETNHRYIEESLTHLEVTNKHTREYVPSVLASLAKQLQVYVAANPNGRLTKKAKVLQMVTQSLLAQLQ